MTRRERPPATWSTEAASTPSGAATAFRTVATQCPQVSPSAAYSAPPVLVTEPAGASVEQQLQPAPEDVSGKSFRFSVPHMSVPFLEKGRWVLGFNGCDGGVRAPAWTYHFTDNAFHDTPWGYGVQGRRDARRVLAGSALSPAGAAPAGRGSWCPECGIDPVPLPKCDTGG
jgi:hypothetical protein